VSNLVREPEEAVPARAYEEKKGDLKKKVDGLHAILSSCAGSRKKGKSGEVGHHLWLTVGRGKKEKDAELERGDVLCAAIVVKKKRIRRYSSLAAGKKSLKEEKSP